MQDASHGAQAGIKQRSAEVGVALLTLVFGLIVIFGSFKVGVGWGSEGPEAGFFPFYVGLFITGGSVINLIMGMRSDPDQLASEWSQLRQVLKVLVPTGIYCFLVEPFGIYITSMLLIAVFMKWLGKYSWALTAAISIGVPTAFFFVFERWFLIPLPKGPVEALFGL